jgi:hypothetical protein
MSENSKKENKFVTFVKPYLEFVDSPRLFTKPYGWLFNLFALFSLLFPFSVLYELINVEFFQRALDAEKSKLIVAAILSLIVIFIASWIVFQIWLNRKKVIVTDRVTSGIVVDALGHLVYTAFEAAATWLGIVGTLGGLITLIFDGGILGFIGIGGYDPLYVIIGSLVGGYFGVIFAKLAGFLFKKIANIIIYVIVRIFNFVVHVIKQLFEFIFIFYQSIVDFLVNGWRVVIALFAKLGNTLLAFAHRKGPDGSNQASITYNS